MALSDLTDEEWFTRLNERRIRQLLHAVTLWAYYDNEQPLKYVAKIIQEQGDRFPPLRINWSALPVDALDERLEMQGWRIAGSTSEDDDLTAIWEDNDLDEAQGEASIASLVATQSFLMVGPGVATDTPLVTVEYPDQVAVEVDPATGRVVAALKVWSSDTESKTHDMATLMLPGRVVTFESGEKAGVQAQPWTKRLEAQQTSPLVPVVPMVNNRRRWRGHSALRDVIPLVDAINQTATNMMAAIEHHALPRRWAVGLSKSDFVDENGRPLKPWQIATGALWGIPHATDEQGEIVSDAPEPKVGQFSASDLQNFLGAIKMLALITAGLAALDPRLFGVTTDNPVSADGIRAAETRLIKRAERQQRARTGPWKNAGRIALVALDRDPDVRLEPMWRDPATPTLAAMADAAQKKLAAGIIDVEQAQEDCGYSLAQRSAMAARRGTAVGQADRIVAGIRGLALPGTSGATAGDTGTQTGQGGDSTAAAAG